MRISFFIRTISVGIVQGTSIVAFAVSTKMFPYLISWLSYYGTNYYYAVIMLCMTVWGSITIQATDNMSLVEIERLYDHRLGISKRPENYGSIGVQGSNGQAKTDSKVEQ